LKRDRRHRGQYSPSVHIPSFHCCCCSKQLPSLRRRNLCTCGCHTCTSPGNTRTPGPCTPGFG
jgi:hypothetical protein